MRPAVRMIRTLIACLLAGVPAAVLRAGQGSATASLPADFIDAYRQRCKTEIQWWARQLDELNDELTGQLVPIGSQPLLPRLETAWSRGPEARRRFRKLLDTVRKYRRWMEQAGCPAWFSIPDRLVQEALRGKRWEALRPLLLPADVTGIELGWNDPSGDTPAWRTPQARTLEWLLLLKWCAAPPPDVERFNLRWVEGEVGVGRLGQWAARLLREERFFHDQYVYRILRPPQLSGLPYRVQVVAGRMAWQPSRQPVHDLAAFVRQKEALLTELLALVVAEGGSNRVSARWFSVAARWPPVFTALQPVRDGTSVRVMEQRPAGTASPRQLYRQLRGSCRDPRVLAAVGNAIYWYQVRRLGRDGTPVAPPCGWSSYVPHNALGTAIGASGRRSAPRPLGRDSKRPWPPASAPQAVGGLYPERAWHQICAWVAEQLTAWERTGGRQHWCLEVENTAGGQRLAFGGQELCQLLRGRGFEAELARPRWVPAGRWPLLVPLLAAGCILAVPGLRRPDRPRRLRLALTAAGAVIAGAAVAMGLQHRRATAASGATDQPTARCRVALVEVEEDRAATVAVQVNGQAAARCVFRIRGPWPPWFAARLWHPGLWLAALGPASLVLWVLVTYVTGRRQRAGPTAWRWAGGVGLAATLLALWWGRELHGCVLFLVLPVTAGWLVAAAGLWAWSRADEVERPALLALCALALAVLLVLLPVPAAEPVAGPIGGTVELSVPADSSIPPALQSVVRKSCLAVYRQLAGLAPSVRRDATAAFEWPACFFDRLRQLVCRPRLWPSWQVAARGGGHRPPAPPQQQTCIRIRPAVWQAQRPLGLVPCSAAGEAVFRRLIEGLVFSGQPDVPLAFSQPAVAARAIVLTTGDGGSLCPPEFGSWPRPASVATLLLLNPSRDANPGRQLLAQQRVAWVAKRSQNLWVLLPSGRLLVNSGPPTADDVALPRSERERSDAPAFVAQDMDRARQAAWGQISEREMERAAERFASAAVQQLQRQRGATSRTVLALDRAPLRWILLLASAVFFAAVPLWLRRRGSVPTLRSAALLLARLLALAAVLAAALALLPDVRGQAWFYGAGNFTALQSGFWWCLAGALVAGIAVGFWLLLLCWPSEFWRRIDPGRSPWPPRAEPWRRVLMALPPALGLVLLAAAVAWLAAGPVALPDSSYGWHAWLPRQHCLSAGLGWSLWLAAGCLLWLGPLARPRANRIGN